MAALWLSAAAVMAVGATAGPSAPAATLMPPPLATSQLLPSRGSHRITAAVRHLRPGRPAAHPDPAQATPFAPSAAAAPSWLIAIFAVGLGWAGWGWRRRGSWTCAAAEGRPARPSREELKAKVGKWQENLLQKNSTALDLSDEDLRQDGRGSYGGGGFSDEDSEDDERDWEAFEEEDDGAAARKPTSGPGGQPMVWTLRPGEDRLIARTREEFDLADSDDEDDEGLLSEDFLKPAPRKTRRTPAPAPPAEEEDPVREARLEAAVEAYLSQHPEVMEGVVTVERRRPRDGRAVGGSRGARHALTQGQPAQDVPNANRLRILSGSAKGRRLESPPVYLRPMMSKVREALFNTLTHIGLFKRGSHAGEPGSATVLDLFAGTGCLGLEALSRGAGTAAFVDLSPECCGTVQKNIALCRLPPSRAITVQADALLVLRRPERVREGGRVLAAAPFSLVTVTPPYEEIDYADLLDALCGSRLVGPDTVVVVEYPKEAKALFTPVVGDKLFGLRNRRYGRTHLAMYICCPEGSPDLRPEEFV